MRTGIDYNKERSSYLDIARKVVYTGPIDEYFGYRWVIWNTEAFALKRNAWKKSIIRA